MLGINALNLAQPKTAHSADAAAALCWVKHTAITLNTTRGGGT